MFHVPYRLWHICLAFVVLLGGSSALADPADCIGFSADGQAQCIPPEFAPPVHSYCIETGLATPETSAARCMTSLGLSSPIQNDQQLISIIDCASKAFNPQGGWAGPIRWIAPGQSLYSNACWSRTAYSLNGVEVRGIARESIPNWSWSVVFLRDRSPYCKTGFANFTQVINGNVELVACKSPCPQGSTVVNGVCVGPLVLAFVRTDASNVYPAGAGSPNSASFIAKVTQNGNPKAGAVVNFTVDVIPNSGGHEHHDASRPKGGLSKTQGLTDANGEVALAFTAPEVAGIHTVQASCANCSNSPSRKEIQVKVPDLLPISPNPPQNSDGSFLYVLTSVDAIHAGAGRYHKNQYYLTEQSRSNLRLLIDAFAAAGWGTVGLNDASMYWGGRYDIQGNWNAPHRGHRTGTEIDISFTRANNPVPSSKQNEFYKKFCEKTATAATFSLLHHFVALPHFHVYLEKQKACTRTES